VQLIRIDEKPGATARSYPFPTVPHEKNKPGSITWYQSAGAERGTDEALIGLRLSERRNPNTLPAD